jgi:hypothetical protein
MNDGIWKYFKTVGKVKAQIYFINKCKQFNVMPKGFFSKPILRSLKSNQLETRFAKIRMNERLNQLHANLFKAELHISTNLGSHPLPEDIIQDLNGTTFREYAASQRKHRHKFNRLLSLRPTPRSPPIQFKLGAVLDLSTRTFSPNELRILSLGFNFRPSLPAFPTQDYILATEAHIKAANLSPENSALLRNAVVNELEKIHKKLSYKPPRHKIFSLTTGHSSKHSKPMILL